MVVVGGRQRHGRLALHVGRLEPSGSLLQRCTAATPVNIVERSDAIQRATAPSMVPPSYPTSVITTISILARAKPPKPLHRQSSGCPPRTVSRTTTGQPMTISPAVPLTRSRATHDLRQLVAMDHAPLQTQHCARPGHVCRRQRPTDRG